MKPSPWDRLFWGISFTGRYKDERHLLLGTAWHTTPLQQSELYPGEPTRPLLFQTRAQAREWCKAKHAVYAGRKDCCKDWRFRPVRVRELVCLV